MRRTISPCWKRYWCLARLSLIPHLPIDKISEAPIPPALVRSVAQPGSALDWGSRGRRFESCRSDQISLDFFLAPWVPILHILLMFQGVFGDVPVKPVAFGVN